MDTYTAQYLPPGGVRTLLRDLGGVGEHLAPLPETWTGVIHVWKTDDEDTQARLWLRNGQVYSADLTGFTPPLTTRLVSAGCLSPEEASELEATVDVENIGSVAVSRHAIDRAIVDELHREVTLAVVSHLYEWETALWAVEETETYPGYVTSPMPLLLVVSAVDERIGQWRAVSRAHPRAVDPREKPQPGPAWMEKAGQEVTPEMAALLSRVDGRISVARLANACGFTRFEMARLLQQALAEGLLVFPSPHDTPANTSSDTDTTSPDSSETSDEDTHPDGSGSSEDHEGREDGEPSPDGELTTDHMTPSETQPAHLDYVPLASLQDAHRLTAQALEQAQEAVRLAEEAHAAVTRMLEQTSAHADSSNGSE